MADLSRDAGIPSVPINLQLADVRQALFDEAKSDANASNAFRYEAGRAVGLMGNAMDTVKELAEALQRLVGEELGGDAHPPRNNYDSYRPVITWADRAFARTALAKAQGGAK